MRRTRLQFVAGALTCAAMSGLCACTSSFTGSIQSDHGQSGAPEENTGVAQQSEPQSLPAAGGLRDPNTCERQAREPADISRAVLAVLGEPISTESVIIDTTSQAVAPFRSATVGSTIDSGSPLQMIGMGERGEALAVAQELPRAEHSSPTHVGIIEGKKFYPFVSTKLLPEQPPTALTPAPLAGTIAHGHAIWTEQLFDGTPSNAWSMAWRVMGAPLTGQKMATELLSSWALTGQSSLPVASGWVPPAFDGTYAYVPAVLPADGQDNAYEEQILQVALNNPGTVISREQGRLPAAIGTDVGWIRDTTGNGPESESDVFTLHWAKPSRHDIEIQTGDFFKVQWLAGDEHFIVIVFQDQCSARSWLGRFDREKDAFTGWVYQKSDGIALSLNDSVAVWGNGSGNVGSEMYRWDLMTDSITALGANEGFSVPFSGGHLMTAIPSFGKESGAPLVQWALEKPID